MVFGRVAVLCNANTLGMAFSLHLVLEINNANHKMPGQSRNFPTPSTWNTTMTMKVVMMMTTILLKFLDQFRFAY